MKKENPGFPAKDRSGFNRQKMQLVLWAIPILVWLLLYLIFAWDRSPQLVPLFSSTNTEEITRVEQFLDSHGIVYDTNEPNIIRIAITEKEQVQSQLLAKGLLKTNPTAGFTVAN
jgi:flagellar biosynthesis/type III secretory pathway M-ring protein FliF/YscJ